MSTVTAAPGSVQSHAATAHRAKHRAEVRSHPTLRQLRDDVRAADADLAARTRAFERGRVALAKAQRTLRAVTAEARAARAVASRAHDDLGRYASAAYRGQQLPTDLVAIMAPAGTTGDTLHGLETLAFTGNAKTDIATFAADAARRAAELEARANTQAMDNARAAYALALAQGDMRVRAAATQRRLAAELRRIAIRQAKAVSANCRASAKIAARYPNGLIPPAVLCAIGTGGYRLRGDAAIAFRQLNIAYKARFGTPMCVASAYRDRASQARVFAERPKLAALPGKSHHGLGIALDLCGGVERFASVEHRWLKANAGAYGWYHPSWAEPGGVTPEPWHWELRVPGLAPAPAAGR